MTIPITNVYYLLLYAWRHVDRKDLVDVGESGKSDLLNLLAHVFALDVRRIIARGLAREYVTVDEEVRGLRGKLDIGMSLKRGLLRSGRTWCRYDELQYDVARNRILKATLRLLLRVPHLDAANREAARSLYQKMDAIQDVPLHPALFRSVQSSRLMRDYDFALRLARLITESVVLDEAGSVARFVDFRQDEARMSQVFEDFVVEFYRLERPEWMPQRRQIRWFQAQGSEESLRRLPGMHTDVYLTMQGRHVILDAKYYANPLSGRFGEGVNSGNLYQLFAYVDNAAAHEPGAVVDGILLYAAPDKPFSFSYRLKGHRLDVRALDLSQDWRSIHDDLLAFVA